MEGKGIWEEDGITAQHCKSLYMKAFLQVNPHQVFAKPQSKSASMAAYHLKMEVDYIKKGTGIHNIEDGEEKNRLLNFHKRSKLGNKYIHQYCLEEICVPGYAEPCQVLRRLKAKKGTPNVTKP